MFHNQNHSQTHQTAEGLLVVEGAVARQPLLNHGQRVIWVVGQANLIVALPLPLRGRGFLRQLVTPLSENNEKPRRELESEFCKVLPRMPSVQGVGLPK